MSRNTREGEQCPNKIIDDFGICYSLGFFLSVIGNTVYGLYVGPKKSKMSTAIELMKRRVPIRACSFGLWGGAFGLAQCVLIHLTKQDSILN